MKPEQLAATMQIILRPNRMAVYLEGSPGTGKTSIAKQVAQAMGLPLIYLHSPTKLPEDFGLPWPSPTDSSFSFRMLDNLPLVGSKHPDEGIVLFDELAQAGPDIQKILANILWEKEVHGHTVKPGWRFIATGNRVSDRAGANRLLSHLRNRMISLTLDVDVEAWAYWAIKTGVDARIVAYLRSANQNLNNFDPNREINATPRAWAEGVSPVLDLLPPENLLEVLQGAVGGAAAEFLGFLRMHGTLPSRVEFLADPAGCLSRIQRGVDRKLGPDVYFALATMLLLDFSEPALPAALDAAKVLPEEYGSLVFQTWMKRAGGKTFIKHPDYLKDGMARYRGAVIGEEGVSGS